MEVTFLQLVIAEDSQGLTKFLDNNVINANTLNRWFRKAARLPGNWMHSAECGMISDRNAWLNVFYHKYVPDELRVDELTNRRRFQRNYSRTRGRWLYSETVIFC